MLVVFDWDGTLVDSVAHIVDSLQKAAQVKGWDVLPFDTVKQVIGLSLPVAVNELYPDKLAADRDIYIKEYRQFFNRGKDVSRMFKGVDKTLVALVDAGHQVAVATGKSRRGLDAELNRFGLEAFFHATRTADETASKPHPMMLNEIIAELLADPADVVMVGDTSYDLEMAENAGVRSIGVSYGVHDKSRLAAFSPVAILDSLGGLMECIAE